MRPQDKVRHRSRAPLPPRPRLCCSRARGLLRLARVRTTARLAGGRCRQPRQRRRALLRRWRAPAPRRARASLLRQRRRRLATPSPLRRRATPRPTCCGSSSRTSTAGSSAAAFRCANRGARCCAAPRSTGALRSRLTLSTASVRKPWLRIGASFSTSTYRATGECRLQCAGALTSTRCWAMVAPRERVTWRHRLRGHAFELGRSGLAAANAELRSWWLTITQPYRIMWTDKPAMVKHQPRRIFLPLLLHHGGPRAAYLQYQTLAANLLRGRCR